MSMRKKEEEYSQGMVDLLVIHSQIKDSLWLQK